MKVDWHRKVVIVVIEGRKMIANVEQLME